MTSTAVSYPEDVISGFSVFCYPVEYKSANQSVFGEQLAMSESSYEILKSPITVVLLVNSTLLPTRLNV